MALVLTRKPGEQITIGDNITVTVEWIRGGKVRLAIAAPRDVVILRGELSPTVAARYAPPTTGGPNLEELDECEPSGADRWVFGGEG